MPLDHSPANDDQSDPTKAKHSWPKTESGTIDWEVVFEAPETGLIARVKETSNHEQLFKVTETTIRELFTRKGDDKEVRVFLAELTDILTKATTASASVEGTRLLIIDLLRRIKRGRITKAEEYAAQQKAKQANGRRRRTSRRDDDRKLAFKQRMVLMGIGGLAAAALLIGAVTTLVVSTASPDRAAIAKTQNTDGAGGSALGANALAPAASGQSGYAIEDVAESQGQMAAIPESTATQAAMNGASGPGRLMFTQKGYPMGEIKAAHLDQLGEHPMTMRPIIFGRNVGGGDAGRKLILPVLTLRDPDSATDVCDWSPVITEIITGVMNRKIPQTGTVSDDQYLFAGEIATQLINQRLGGVVVESTLLLHQADRGLTDAKARCGLVAQG